MIGGPVGGRERLARWGGGFVAPGKTTIKTLYGKNRRPSHLSVSLSLSFLSTKTHTTTGCCWISALSRKLYFLASCTWNLDRQLEIDYYRMAITHTHAHKHVDSHSFRLAIHTLNICVYILVNDSFPKWYWACKQTPLVFITLNNLHTHANPYSHPWILQKTPLHTLEKKMTH